MNSSVFLNQFLPCAFFMNSNLRLQLRSAKSFFHAGVQAEDVYDVRGQVVKSFNIVDIRTWFCLSCGAYKLGAALDCKGAFTMFEDVEDITIVFTRQNQSSSISVGSRFDRWSSIPRSDVVASVRKWNPVLRKQTKCTKATNRTWTIVCPLLLWSSPCRPWQKNSAVCHRCLRVVLPQQIQAALTQIRSSKWRTDPAPTTRQL